ncbi:hypothetical protein [Acidiluteibacter ferrifornacis]|uniref:Transglycosylase n=1 Tax=Acidiluteibacter ferrifornacis TaxID=2692424 RepID=A0A6N9NJE0_9FLAO|nr:hypothetical protein [Acidiluteibacter ferrifornacis]NBG65601.1 hypothetical protein [Acidiluteibacter ferrifornacis]
MKAVGTILLIIGLVGTLLFGFQAIQDSESFSFLGIDIAVSKADWTPLIVSGIIFLIGLVMIIRKKG